MAKKRRKARRWPAAEKRRAVQLLRKYTVDEVAQRLDVYGSVIRLWAKNPEFGGNPDFEFISTRSARLPARDISLLPTRSASSRRARQSAARRLVPVIFRCPHCEGLVTMEER